uniref:Uncharacterized protein n=1 Tax=Pelusios castaneus TaxID=367368 RepID=A0A8C8VJU3_9SAUR
WQVSGSSGYTIQELLVPSSLALISGSIMWHAVVVSHRSHWSPQPKHFKLVTVYILVLLLSLSFTSGQSRLFNHQLDNRSPEIDPFWYVGRGVRPIGRFGKRQLRHSHRSLRPGISSLELIINALQEQETLNAEDDAW